LPKYDYLNELFTTKENQWTKNNQI
jgi:hypothetical protein